MSAPRAIQGDFADIRTVKSRSVVQVVIELPIEDGESIIRMLGFPQPSKPVRVALARLAEPSQIEAKAQPAANSNGREHGPWASLTPTLQSVLRCQTPAFWTFLREEGESNCNSEDEAATYVRAICGVNSRSSLTGKAATKWLALDSRYQAWLAGAGL